MSTQVSQGVYYSLHPKNTCIGERMHTCCCFGRVVLGVVAVIAVPLEILGRLFANLAIGVHRFFHIKTKQLTPTVPIRSEMVKKIKEQNLPIATQQTKPLIQDICVLKARGTLYGQAIGDALGLIAEFSSKSALLECKPQKLEFSDLPNISQSRYNTFAQRGWTDDTDQMIAIVRADFETHLDSSVCKEIRYARHLRNWKDHGLDAFSTISGNAFISRSDSNSTDFLRQKITYQDIGVMTSLIVNKTRFLDTPYNAALEIWKADNKPIQRRHAANGALMRTSALGAIYRNNLEKAKEEAIRYAEVTHVDPRSIASAVALTIAIAVLHTKASLDNAMQQAEQIAVEVLWKKVEALQSHMIQAESAKWKESAKRFEDELRACMRASLSDLALCENPTGYTFKCLGAAFYSAREAQRLISEGTTPEDAFRTVLETIIFEGGDADTNAAAAGALLGAYLGEDAIPASWRKDLHPQDKSVLEEALQQVDILAQSVS